MTSDETQFLMSHKTMEIEDLQLLSHFSLEFNHQIDVQKRVFNKTFYLKIKTTINLCNIELNFCKQIKIKFVLPLVLSHIQSEETLIKELLFSLTEL